MSTPQAADGRPESDVSSTVGLVGLVGLFVWLLVCRNWAGIGEALNLPGPRAPLSGPNAALLSVFVAAVPMVLWSIFHDKVHLRASTGIDWKNPRPLRSIIDISITKLAGLWATWALIGFFYCVCRWYWKDSFLFAMHVIATFAVPMFILSVPYVLWLDRRLNNPRDGAWHFGAMLIGREAYELDEVWHHLRAWAVKGFFTAFMVSILPGGFQIMTTINFRDALASPASATGTLNGLFFFIDVQIGTVGYLLTLKPFDAQIRSANPYLAGWVAALLCYPPFVMMGMGNILTYQTNTAEWDVWMQGHPALMWIWGTWLVTLTAIYAWATFAFGIRFSNLTYRGVVTNGPYKYTRHPAYLAKNTYWWCSTLPFLVTSGSVVDMVRNVTFICVTNAIYYWRARTEEKHLLAEDPKYRAYYEWMAEHGPITRALRRLTGLLRPSGPRLQPAE
ncbi:MAG: protein-S-isoprenylcysteine methyltransferase [Sphingomonadales bacterium]|nr:protein-S-isoprenylcysteine methyltransferase [Sphingomonadales bacterium]